MPHVLTTLTYTAFQRIINAGLSAHYNALKIEYPIRSKSNDQFGYFYKWKNGRLYQNVATFAKLSLAEFGLGIDEVSKEFPDVPKSVLSAQLQEIFDKNKSQVKPVWRVLKMLYNSSKSERNTCQIVGKLTAWCKQIESTFYNQNSSKVKEENLDMIRSIRAFEEGMANLSNYAQIYMEHHMLLSIFMAFLGKIIDSNKISAILSRLGNVSTAAQDLEIWELAKTIHSNNGLHDLVHRIVHDGIEKWEAEFDVWNEFLTSLNQFLNSYGFRCENELEISSLTWRQNAIPLFKVLLSCSDAMRGSSGSSIDAAAQARIMRSEFDEKPVAHSRNAAVSEALNDVPWYQRKLAAWLITKTQDLSVLRENAKVKSCDRFLIA